MPVANIVFCCFVFLDLKSGEVRVRTYVRTDWPTDGQHVQIQWSLLAVTLGWPSGSICNMVNCMWIIKQVHQTLRVNFISGSSNLYMIDVSLYNFVRPYVHTSVLQRTPCVKIIAVAWWVILNSQYLFM